MPNSFEGLLNPGGQEQNQPQYVNIREVPGSGGKLFVGDVANEQEIEGGDQPDGYLFVIAGVDIDQLLLKKRIEF